MTRELIAGACPDPQMLSAYLDGKLDPTERGRIEDHISRCEDCYFVVRETALVWAEAGTEETPPAGTQRETPSGGGEVVQATFGQDVATPAAPAPVEAPVADPRRPKASSFARYFMPIAATLVVAAGALALWKQSQANADPRAALVAAVGERRFFDARLTGGFKFGERVSPRRGSDLGTTGAASEEWEVLAAAAKVRQDLIASKDGGAMATLAASHLFLGEVDQGIQLLQQSLAVPGASERERALLFSDLSGALLIRGMQRNDAGDLERALANADSALRAPDSLPEALHNRALALELLGRSAEAAAAWEACAAKETDPRWREEALRRRAGLSGR